MQNLSSDTQPGSSLAVMPTKHILIIEDNPVHQRLMENELRGDYELAFAADGQTAQAYLKDGLPLKFDLLVLDSLIPARPGEQPNSAEAIEILKNAGAGPAVVVVSGSPTDDLRAEFRRFGVSRIFEKPFSLTEFREYIDALLRETEAK
ncbi:MAG TPA: response regulator [Pyrinomonadaceae bacterium]